MDRVKRFLDYTEIKTKITSTLTFMLVLAYLFAAGIPIRLLPTLVFFFGMLLFDLTVTTINNYNDTKKAGQKLQFRRKTALRITLLLLLAACAMGIWLVFLTDALVLALGGLCFIVGLMYSYGPVPISHGPYGELVSGVFYGVFIPAILVYISAPAEMIFAWSSSGGVLSASIKLIPAVGVALMCVTPACLTANIMLANNICDVQQDIQVGRHTLPSYLGKKALYLFAGLYYVTYLAITALVIFGYVHPIALLALLTIIPVQRNISRFFKKQEKSETFIVSIRNFIIIISAHILLIFAGALLPG